MTAAKRTGPLAPHPVLHNAFFDKMKDALEKPDVHPGSALRVVQTAPEEAAAPSPPTNAPTPESPAQAAVSIQPDATGSAQPAAAPAPAHAEPLPSAALPLDDAPAADAMSVSVPRRSLKARNAPLEVASDLKRWGGTTKERAVDMTLSLSPELADRLVQLTGYEMMRLKRKTSTSEVIRHLVAYAIGHVENNAVIATTDGLGLHIKEGSAQ